MAGWSIIVLCAVILAGCSVEDDLCVASMKVEQTVSLGLVL
jgi:hypothetical protein